MPSVNSKESLNLLFSFPSNSSKFLSFSLSSSSLCCSIAWIISSLSYVKVLLYSCSCQHPLLFYYSFNGFLKELVTNTALLLFYTFQHIFEWFWYLISSLYKLSLLLKTMVLINLHCVLRTGNICNRLFFDNCPLYKSLPVSYGASNRSLPVHHQKRNSSLLWWVFLIKPCL